MADFQFLHDTISDIWTILAPRRKTRPNIAHATETAVCPFCPGREDEEEELFRIGGEPGDSDWQVRVLANKFPFAPHHEVIIHSPDHHKNVDELPVTNVSLLLMTYRARFKALEGEGKVYIFNNHGVDGGESLPHPHTQLVVIPETAAEKVPDLGLIPDTVQETDYFTIFCPQVSQWPDEVWIAPKRQGEGFGTIEDAELSDLALALQRVVQLMDMRHGHEFPFNFYISPAKKWYLRLIPRIKRLGGFEVGTGIFVNTQDPADTIRFIKSNLPAYVPMTCIKEFPILKITKTHKIYYKPSDYFPLFVDKLWECITTRFYILRLPWLLATIASMAVKELATPKIESLAQIPSIDVLFLHGYIEQPVIGPSLPDASTMFVADAAVELIKAGKVKQVVITTSCDYGDPERNLSVAEKTSYYMQAQLGEAFPDVTIQANPVANTTIQEIEQLNQLATASTQDGRLVKSFAALCLDPHAERVDTLRQHLMNTEIAAQIPLYKAGDILVLSEDKATREYAQAFLHSEGAAAFALREETYRRLLRYPHLGIPLMRLADFVQGNRKFLAEKGYQVALRRVTAS